MYGQIVEEVYREWNEITPPVVEKPLSIPILTDLAMAMLQNDIVAFLGIVVRNHIAPEVFKAVLLYFRFSGVQFMKDIIMAQIKMEIQKISQLIHTNELAWVKIRMYQEKHENIQIQVRPVDGFVIPQEICGCSNIAGVFCIDTRHFNNILEVHRLVVAKKVDVVQSDINLKIIYPSLLEQKRRQLCAIMPSAMSYKDNRQFVENMYKRIHSQVNASH